MKSSKRKTFSAAEKTSLLEAYQGSGKIKKQWCKENGVGLSTLQRWQRQEKDKNQPQPLQSWVPVISTVPEKAKALEIQVGKCIIPIDAKTDLNFLAGVLKVLVEVC